MQTAWVEIKVKQVIRKKVDPGTVKRYTPKTTFWAPQPAQLRQHYSFNHTRTCCCQETITLIADHVSHFAWYRESYPLQLLLQNALCFTQTRTNRCWTHKRQLLVWLMKGHVDPKANQYVPNMQWPLWLVMKQQTLWFIIMIPWAKECCCIIKPWTCEKLTELCNSTFILPI